MALIPTWFPRGAEVSSASCPTNGGGMPATISQITISMWGSPRNDIEIDSVDSGTTGGNFSCEFGIGGGGPAPSPGSNVGSVILGANNRSPAETLINFTIYQVQTDNVYDATSGGLEYASSLFGHYLLCIDFIAQTIQLYYNDALAAYAQGTWGPAHALKNAASRWSLRSFGGCYYNEVWVAPVKVDLSITANRRQFINADFSPVQLPTNGQVTFNTGAVTPAIYLRATPWQLGTDAYGTPTHPSSAHPISDFLTNRGTGPAWTGLVYGDTGYDGSSSARVILSPGTNVDMGADVIGFPIGGTPNNFELIMISGRGWGPPQIVTSATDLGFPATFRYALFSIWFKSQPTAEPAFSWEPTGGSGGLQVDIDFTPYATDIGTATATITARNGTTSICVATIPLSFAGFSPQQGQHLLVSIDTVGQFLQCYLGGAKQTPTVTWNSATPMTKAATMRLRAWNGSDQCIGEVYYTDTSSFYDITAEPTSGQPLNLRAFIEVQPFATYDSFPVPLGSNGQGPTNVVPRVYLRAANADANGAGWAANLGTGGSFSPVPPLCAVPVSAITAPDFAFMMDEDTTLAAAVVATGAASIVYSIVTPPTQSPYTFNADGTFVYDATWQFSGVDTFVYRATDASDSTSYAQGTVTITVRNAFPLEATKVLLPSAELQFADANGRPYAGGTLETLVVGTDTPKDTWNSPDGSSENTNPIILDSAGRCIVFGDGAYRTILRDSLGNEIWDKPTFTYVSVAMMPVVGAPTIAEAVRLLGISDGIDAAVAAEAALRAAADTAETNRAEAAESALQTALNNEIARAEAAEAALGTRIDGLPVPAQAVALVHGTGVSSATGICTVNFVPPFPTLCMTYGLDLASFDQTGGFELVDEVLTRTTMTYTWTLGDGTTPRASQSFNYYATGY